MAVLGAVLAGGPAAAQEPQALGEVTGVVFDSLAGAPVAGAQVWIGTGVASGRTDAQGRFTLRAPEGTYAVEFHHRGLSDWSALRHPSTVRVEDGRAVSVRVATASRETVLARTCGSSGVVLGGLVRDLLTLVPLTAAKVSVETTRGEGPHGQVIYTTGEGAWFVCLPEKDAAVRVSAHLGDAESSSVEAPSGTVRVRDLYVQVSEPAALQGEVLDGENGVPLADARVEVLGTRLATLTADDGRFSFRGVPPGGVQLAVERLGYGRKVALVRAEGGSTARVKLELFAEAIALDSMVVTVEGGVIARNAMGTRFDGMSRPQIDSVLHRVNRMDHLLMLANVPGLLAREVDYLRDSGFRQPGVCIELQRKSAMASRQCSMLEVYVNDVRMADPEVFLALMDPATVERFQILTPSNAGIQYMGTPRSRNGILLIWTRRR